MSGQVDERRRQRNAETVAEAYTILGDDEMTAIRARHLLRARQLYTEAKLDEPKAKWWEYLRPEEQWPWIEKAAAEVENPPPLQFAVHADKNDPEDHYDGKPAPLSRLEELVETIIDFTAYSAPREMKAAGVTRLITDWVVAWTRGDRQANLGLATYNELVKELQHRLSNITALRG